MKAFLTLPANDQPSEEPKWWGLRSILIIYLWICSFLLLFYTHSYADAAESKAVELATKLEAYEVQLNNLQKEYKEIIDSLEEF